MTHLSNNHPKKSVIKEIHNKLTKVKNLEEEAQFKNLMKGVK